MAELNNTNRGIFSQGIQRTFILEAQKQAGISTKELAGILGVNHRSVNAWKNEDYSLPLQNAQKISEISGVEIPPHEIRDRYWYVHKGAKIGGKKTYEKYGYAFGNPEKRKAEWKKWWNTSGRFKQIVQRRSIKEPRYSKKLAEFIGILLGDGGISERQVIVSLNNVTDKEYILYVCDLITALFGIRPSINPRSDALVSNVTVSRTDLVDYCITLGLLKGNKVRQQIDIPAWVKDNTGFSRLCIRGLMDTDGSIFNECHRIKGRLYCYPRLSLVSYSKPLRESAFAILKSLGFDAKIRNNRSVSIESLPDIHRYFKVVGTSNPKHRVRFEKFTKKIVRRRA